MAEDLTIRERILDRMATMAAAITDVVAAHRRNPLEDTAEHLHLYVVPEAEEADDAAFGDDATGTTLNTFTITVGVFIAPDKDETDGYDKIYNRWLGRIKEKFLVDPALLDVATDHVGEPLSNTGGGIRYLSSNEPPDVEDASEFFAAVTFLVPYEEYRDDPYAGPAITKRNA